MHDVSESVMKANLDHIDNHIDQMHSILEEEMSRLTLSFDLYIKKLVKCKRKLPPESELIEKLENAQRIFENAKAEVMMLKKLIPPLQNIKLVNKLIRFALQHQELVPTYMGTISHVCLGQLKSIKTKYHAILSSLRSDMTTIWRNREVSNLIELVLTVNQLRFNKFIEIFHEVEVQYADISLSAQRSAMNVFQQYVVLRMISNRLQTEEEQRIIENLFPDWINYDQRVA